MSNLYLWVSDLESCHFLCLLFLLSVSGMLFSSSDISLNVVDFQSLLPAPLIISFWLLYRVRKTFFPSTSVEAVIAVGFLALSLKPYNSVNLSAISSKTSLEWNSTTWLSSFFEGVTVKRSEVLLASLSIFSFNPCLYF